MLLAVTALLGLAGAPAAQNEYAFVATISDTLGVNTDRLCLGDATRGDIGCPTYAPSVSSGGLLTATSVLTGGLTVTGATSLSTISATVGDFTTLRVNGVPVTGGGGAASPTNVPAFSVYLSSNQTGIPSAPTVIRFDTVERDTFNNYNTGNYRFTPTIGGNYLITVNTYCIASGGGCNASISKNGSAIGYGTLAAYSTFSTVVYLNGSTDYVQGNIYAASTETAYGVAGGLNASRMTGSLLASGNGLISGSTALGDRITSTSANVVAMAGGTISFTTGGTSGTAYLDTLGRFVGPGISTTGAISATSIYAGESIQLASPTAVTVCDGSTAGSLRYNSPTTTLELCTGSGWQPMGVGIPAGTISAFASTTCPTGWSEYTAARGRFLRGIDNGAGNDPSGTRTPGAAQDDLFRSHTHKMATDANADQSFSGSYMARGVTAYSWSGTPFYLPAGSNEGGAETRPKNVAVTFCQFNGTSNGWNNPLSGGAGGTPGGSDTQVQYNSGGSFAGSSGLTFNNAASRLTATNVSASAVEVTGRVSATVMQLGESNDTCTTATLGTIRRNPATGKLQICRL
ncbi:MAG TPA: hypothetical protein VGV17_24765 [Bosea sp. (in: a-proteobacteria)]|uniref:hypothetical protein n=1 Tax=Bosea sp. (in: a-proteobacteria) TaxID=1871050 RepID=UPI002DDCBFBA|nr:hypothetical protein [Bosea sp. (in: a-proteobacteria)]HEV2556974.1 hypothetical protein [Bosea sp. (in: a-proteobacteria)]